MELQNKEAADRFMSSKTAVKGGRNVFKDIKSLLKTMGKEFKESGKLGNVTLMIKGYAKEVSEAMMAAKGAFASTAAIIGGTALGAKVSTKKDQSR